MLRLKKLHTDWMTAKNKLNLKENMPPKYHYLKESVEFMCLFMDDESTEGYNVICNDLSNCYSNQLGVLKVQYMMSKLYLITCPKYCQTYTMKSDDK